MIEYNTEQMTEKDLIDAANRIFSIEEQDFEKIKSEKWYQTLFHAITLNQDGKKYAVKGIRSLAKLQQLFMTIYVKNYRKSHDQLNEIIDAVTKNSEAIKRLYGACVLNLEEQLSLSSLDAYDAEILALFLGEYRNSEGVVPDEVKKYNRGVLKALDQNVPKGVLDNHQIRKLKNPKVVYRCFMEQSAVDGTIDSQEWTDKIYEDLRDFELSDNSKNEIKESVKYEAEIAGVDYFIVKYTKDNAGVLDTDFEIDIEASVDPIEAQKKELNKQMDLINLNIAFMKFDQEFLSALFIRELDFNEPLVTLDIPIEDEIKEDISNGEIKLGCLKDSVQRTLDNGGVCIHAYKLGEMDDDFNVHNHYFLIATIDGYFFFVEGKIAFVEYDSVRSVKQDSNSVTISAWRVKWYSENGTEESDTNEIVIRKNRQNERYLGALRRGIEHVIKECGGYVESSEDKVEEIVGKYIEQISKSSSSVPYLVKDFGYSDDKKRKKLKNALSKYALKVREDEVIGFIDTSLFGNGGDGILFSKHGIAFDYAFEKIFVKYEEINSMSIKKGKDLVLYGEFSERKDDCNDPSISNIYFNLSALKECLEEIKYVI